MAVPAVTKKTTANTDAKRGPKKATATKASKPTEVTKKAAPAKKTIPTKVIKLVGVANAK